LQRAIPGRSLKNRSFESGKKNIEIACNIAKRLHQAQLSKDTDFPQIEELLATLDKKWEIPNEHLQKARFLKQQLLAKNSASKVLLHGDLHQDNIISQKTTG